MTQAPDDTKQHGTANRLIDSNDPYLLLHARNPVDWYPWGPEALARAKRENLPIFVSFGYSTCYWCHVAERTIYSNPEIAKLMNAWFVNIKIDREQRPDLDSVYMLATQLMTGHGGWPNNVFLTPELKPFYAGSYFPPADDASGRPGFPTILKALHEAWTDRPQEVLKQANKIYQAMLSARQQTAGESAVPIKPADWLSRARETTLQDFDPAHGGLGTGPTKFPREPLLNLLLFDADTDREPRLLEALTKTLDAMALGGIQDHLGGGFHRYSTERTWSVPHFEKMLYDNAQLLGIYANAYRLTHNPLYRQVAENVAGYLAREMMAPEGGFFAAQDAEVAGDEGVSYLWRRSEIESILGSDTATRFFQVYALTPIPVHGDSSNMADDEPGVLRVRVPVSETLQRVGGKEIGDELALLAPARAKLLEARNKRPQPARDEKIILAWNGMTIEALVQTSAALHNPQMMNLARQAAERLWKQAFDPKSGELKHELFGGRSQIRGYLDDYALLGIAFLALADATKETQWQTRAAQLTGAMLRRFAQGDSLATSVAVEDLLIAPMDDGDNTAPTGTSAAIELLARMHRLTGKQEYAGALARVVARLSTTLQNSPGQWPSAVVALNRFPLPAQVARKANETSHEQRPVAQLGTAQHVHASGTVRSMRDHDAITVTVKVDAGYHVNANPASFDYLVATALSVDSVPDLRVHYPTAKLFKPAFAADGLRVYAGTITLKGTAPKGSMANRNPLAATLAVQACDDEVCLPPATLPLKINRQ